MVKKEGESTLGKVKDAFFNAFSTKVFTRLKDEIEGFVTRIEDHIQKTVEVVIEKLIASSIMVIGFGFLILSFSFYLMEYQSMNKTFAFLITGGALVVLSIVIKYFIMRKEMKGGN